MSTLTNLTAGVVAPVAPASPLITNDPNRVEFAVDTLGRRIGAKQLSAIDMFELTLLMGQHSGNQAALNQAMMAASVVKIDALEYARPTSFNELKARIAILNFPGYLAAAEAVGKFGPAEENVDAIKN